MDLSRLQPLKKSKLSSAYLEKLKAYKYELCNVEISSEEIAGLISFKIWFLILGLYFEGFAIVFLSSEFKWIC